VGFTQSSDGQLLFLANMAKMNHKTPLGSRIAEVHNGSSLFTGDAGQGESNIRRWLLENDWLEAIVALPLNLFYNTGIATYIWVLTNRKPEHRKGKVQLIDVTNWFKPLRKNLGKKNCELAPDDIQRICETYLAFEETEQSKIFPNAGFGYWKVSVERPLRLHSQLSVKAIESLRFASGDEELRGEIYEQLGDVLFENFASVQAGLEALVTEWGAGDDEEGDDGAAKKGLPEKKKRKLLDPKTWERDGRLVETANALRRELGDELFEDHNLFRKRVAAALDQLKIKTGAAELKLILRAVSWRVETAPPVIAKIYKPDKAAAIQSDPLRGFYDAEVDGKNAWWNMNRTLTCATRSRCLCSNPAASRHSSAAKFCLTRRTRGLMNRRQKSATRFPSRAILTNRSRSARLTNSAPTSRRWKKKPKACSTRL
jgi:type I restriction enzyme M protein